MTVFAAQSRFTFESFIPSEGTEFGFRAALAVAREPGTAYSPLLLHGPANAGKTHLLTAVADALRAAGRERVILTDGRTFARECRHARLTRDLAAFRAKYDDCGALLMDDVHVVRASIVAARELGALVERLHAKRVQVVLTSATWDGRRGGFWDRILSRFEWAMRVPLAPVSPCNAVL